MAQLVAALITVHGLLSFLSDVYGLLDPSCRCKNNKEAQCTCGNETIQNPKGVLVHPKDKQDKKDDKM